MNPGATPRPQRPKLWRWRLPFGFMVLWQVVYLLFAKDSDWWPWKALSIYAYTLIGVYLFLEGRDRWRCRPKRSRANASGR